MHNLPPAAIYGPLPRDLERELADLEVALLRAETWQQRLRVRLRLTAWDHRLALALFQGTSFSNTPRIINGND